MVRVWGSDRTVIIFLSEIISLFFDTGLIFPRFQAPQANFKAVLIAVDVTRALQTKCKICFGRPRMILQAL